jgi:hypothetical protein
MVHRAPFVPSEVEVRATKSIVCGTSLDVARDEREMGR